MNRRVVYNVLLIFCPRSPHAAPRGVRKPPAKPRPIIVLYTISN